VFQHRSNRVKEIAVITRESGKQTLNHKGHERTQRRIAVIAGIADIAQESELQKHHLILLGRLSEMWT